MRVTPGVGRRLAPLSLIFCSAMAFGCDGLPAGQPLWIRLSAPVSSYSSKVGSPVEAVLTEPVLCDGAVGLPAGTKIDGVVHSVRKVGWGIRHETSALGLQFTRALPPEGPPVEMSAAVVEVENAREQVSKGVIQGIRSSDTPQGRINSRLRHLPTWNPYSDAGLIIFKAAFPIFPEPEIYYPAGTDLRLKLTQPITWFSPSSDALTEGAANETQDAEFATLVRSLPRRATTLNLVDADVVNLVFVGSREQVQSAFQQAGWNTSDPQSKRAYMRNFYAVLNNSGYAQEPMRPFLLNGQPADMNWQKSLNSYSRRDHLRIWQWPDPVDGETIWLSSSTHDTQASLSLKYRQFVHHITPNIDEERSKVIRDLTVAGCVKSVHLVPRPGFGGVTQNATGDTVITDGAVAFVELKPCQPIVPTLESMPATANYKPGNHAFRYFRRQILTFRSDIWRANIIYGIYDLGRMSVQAMRHHSALANERAAYAELSSPQHEGSK